MDLGGGRKKNGGGVWVKWSPGAPQNPRLPPQNGLTLATKRSTSFLEVSLAARGPHWYLNSGGSVRGMGVISRYLRGVGGVKQ